MTVELARSTNLVISAAPREVDPLYRSAEGLVLTKDGDGIVNDSVFRDEHTEWNWGEPSGFPTVAAVREAIVAAAGPDPFSVGEVDVRGLRPVVPGAAGE